MANEQDGNDYDDDFSEAQTAFNNVREGDAPAQE